MEEDIVRFKKKLQESPIYHLSKVDKKFNNISIKRLLSSVSIQTLNSIFLLTDEDLKC